jgi:hypothetical protein
MTQITWRRPICQKKTSKGEERIFLMDEKELESLSSQQKAVGSWKVSAG